MMLPWLIVAVAAVVGILVGFWLRSASAAKRSAELERDLDQARNQLAQVQLQSSERAGFEALAAERQKTIERIAAERDSFRTELQAKNDVERTQAAHISELQAELRKERESLAEKIALLDNAERTLSDKFEALAGGILEKKSDTLSANSQKELGALLAPLREQLEGFRRKVEEAQSDSKTGVAKLEGLIGGLGNLNQQLAEEARNLSAALRGSSKAQGDWGEFILRDLLDKAGLREGEQFSFQQTFSGLESENGDRTKSARTDVIVSLPGGRNLIIDSKVSLTAYTDFANAAGDTVRTAALKLHMASVRAHVGSLAKAKYDRLPGIESPDFVVMFVPIEPAFLIALQNDADLWADAYQQGVLLVGPTTLLYVIRIVNVLWQQELQARGVREVMKRGGELYDKFVGFVSDLEAVGKNLRDADQSYSLAMKKLTEGRGNLVRRVEMLKELGIPTGKSLPKSLLDAAAVDQFELSLPSEALEAGASTDAQKD